MPDSNTDFNNCLYFTASKLSRAITRMAEEEFQSTGLSPTYGFLLMLVSEQPGITPTEISEDLHLTPSTITRFLDKLEHKGLVERRSDGKKSCIKLTEQGHDLLAEIRRAWGSLGNRYMKLLGEEESAELNTLVNQAASKLK